MQSDFFTGLKKPLIETSKLNADNPAKSQVEMKKMTLGVVFWPSSSIVGSAPIKTVIPIASDNKANKGINLILMYFDRPSNFLIFLYTCMGIQNKE